MSRGRNEGWKGQEDMMKENHKLKILRRNDSIKEGKNETRGKGNAWVTLFHLQVQFLVDFAYTEHEIAIQLNKLDVAGN